MTGAIVSLVALYCLVVFIGKHVSKPGRGSALVLAFVAAAQVLAVLYFIFTAKNPVN